MGVVFDLDDTLYLERDYVRSGYRAVSQAVAESAGAPPAILFDFMWGRFATGERTRTFDCLLESFPLAKRNWSVRALVDTYRRHSPSIHLGEVVESLLAHLARERTYLGIVSDGFLVAQQAKTEALGLDRWLDSVILTDEWGRGDWKPSPRAFLSIERTSGLSGRSLTYVGDNPAKDFIGPNRLGWTTVRLRLEGQLLAGADPSEPLAAPTVTVDSLEGLVDLLVGPRGTRTP